MNSQKDFTKYDINIQAAFHNWNGKILPYLPDHLDEMAYQSRIQQRKRGIHSAAELLKVLFLYASSKFSFRILAAAACALKFPVFRILHGESIMPGQSRSFTSSCMPCFRLSLRIQTFLL